MREIKFRCFSKKNKRMWDSESLRNMGGFALLSGHSSQDFLVLPCPQDDYIIMQYTGLKDKNGIDIYEGDIISTLLLNFYDKDNKLDRKTCIEKNYDFGVVEYVDYNCSFMIMRRQYKDRVTDQWNNSMALQPCRDNLEMEVIGNIYEDKELLEGF